jgi:hypothetical protein
LNDSIQIIEAFVERETDVSGTIRESKKVKESRNRPGVAQRVPGGLGSQNS